MATDCQVGRTSEEQIQDGAVTRSNRNLLATELEQLLAAEPNKEQMLAKLTDLAFIRDENKAEFYAKDAEGIKAAIREMIVDFRFTAPVQKLSMEVADRAREATEREEKPMELTAMIEAMQRTATEKNRFYNFASKAAMKAALEKLSTAAITAIVAFSNVLAYRRTEKSFPILVNNPDGGDYFLTESAPSERNVNIDAAAAKVLVENWGNGIKSPNNAQWALLKSLGLVDLDGIDWEWLPSEPQSAAPGYAWIGDAEYACSNERDANSANAIWGVRALRNVPKA